MAPDLRAQCTPPPTGMSHWWRGEADATDAIGSAHGTQTGAPGYTTGNVGQAFTFDSNDDLVTIPNAASLNPTASGFTVELWMRGLLAQPTAEVTLLDKSHDSNDNTGWVLGLDPVAGGLGAGWATPTGIVGTPPSSGPPVLDGAWHHVALTWDGSTVRCYADGTERSSVAATSFQNNTRPLNFAHWYGRGTPQRFFRGDMDEVTIYPRALSVSEIAAIHAAGSAGKCRSPLWTVATHGTGIGPRGLVLADLDAAHLPDLRPDLATANSGSNDVTIRFNDGAGGLGGTPKTIALGAGASGPLAVAAGDLDGDGAADDLAVACNDTHNVAIVTDVNAPTPGVALLGSGGLRPVHVAVGDLDGTATQDIVVAREGEFLALGGGVGVIRDGGAATTLSGGTATQIVKVAIASLDRFNGNPVNGNDVVAVARGATDEVQLFTNNGSGALTFQFAIALSTSGLANGLCAADLDNDGDVDLAVLEVALVPTAANNLKVYRFAESGAFGPEDYTPVTIPLTGSFAIDAACGDFEDDTIDCFASRMDIAIVNAGTGNLVSVHGFTGSSFASSDAPLGGTNPVAVAVADLDGDGCADLAVANEGSNAVTVSTTVPPKLLQTYGTGCAGSNGTPAIAGSGLPALGTTYTVSVTSGKPRAPALLLFSPGCANLQLGSTSCFLLVNPPVVSVLRFLDGQGAGGLSFAIPAAASNAGFDAFFQWAVLDSAGPFASLALSNGLRLQLGT